MRYASGLTHTHTAQGSALSQRINVCMCLIMATRQRGHLFQDKAHSFPIFDIFGCIIRVVIMTSTAYSIVKRETKKGFVYDARFFVYINGKKVQKRLCGFATKKATRLAVAEYFANFQNKEKTSSSNKLLKYEKLRDEFFVWSAVSHAKSSTYAIKSVFDKSIDYFFMGKDLSKLTKTDCLKWQDALWTKRKTNGEPYAYATLKKTRAYLVMFLNWCRDRYDIFNPFDTIKMPRNTSIPRVMKIWTKADFDKFIKCVDDIEYKTFFTLLYYTGMRVGEACALSPQDIVGNEIIVNKTITNKVKGKPFEVVLRKNKTYLRVPISKTLQNALNAFLRSLEGNRNFLFGGSRPLSFNTIRRKLDKYSEIAENERIRVHELRHSFVSMMIHYGANYMVVADLIGDKPTQVLQTYGHLWADDKWAIMDKII